MFAGANAADDDENLPIDSIDALMYFMTSFFPCCFLSDFAAGSRLRHNVQRPRQIVCPNRDSVCQNNDKIYLTIVTFRFLLLFFAFDENRDHFSLPVRGLPSFGFPPRR